MLDRQTVLNNKLSLFLTTLGEQGVNEFSPKGICVAYGFLNFRSDIIGEIDKHADRMRLLTILDDKDNEQLLN